MTAQEVLHRVIGALDRAGIPYMLTGSYASSYHGIPRGTQDLDVVISPTPDQLRSLAGLLPADEYYMDLSAALDAQKREGMFNILDHRTGWKVDCIIRKSRPFSLREFERRFAVDVGGASVWMATAEDILIAKLEWAKRGRSDRQIEDAAGIYRNHHETIDTPYIEGWVRQLGLEAQWAAARRAGGG